MRFTTTPLLHRAEENRTGEIGVEDGDRKLLLLRVPVILPHRFLHQACFDAALVLRGQGGEEGRRGAAGRGRAGGDARTLGVRCTARSASVSL